jgi:hypothetical protein
MGSSSSLKFKYPKSPDLSRRENQAPTAVPEELPAVVRLGSSIKEIPARRMASKCIRSLSTGSTGINFRRVLSSAPVRRL